MQCNYTPMRIARHHISWVKSLLSEAVYWRLHLGLGIGGSALLLRQFIPTGNKTSSFSFSKYFPHFPSPLQKNSSSNIFPIWSSFCVCVYTCMCFSSFSIRDREWMQTKEGGPVILIDAHSLNLPLKQAHPHQHFRKCLTTDWGGATFFQRYIWWELGRPGATIFLLPILGLYLFTKIYLNANQLSWGTD